MHKFQLKEGWYKLTWQVRIKNNIHWRERETKFCYFVRITNVTLHCLFSIGLENFNYNFFLLANKHWLLIDFKLFTFFSSRDDALRTLFGQRRKPGLIWLSCGALVVIYFGLSGVRGRNQNLACAGVEVRLLHHPTSFSKNWSSNCLVKSSPILYFFR